MNTLSLQLQDALTSNDFAPRVQPNVVTFFREIESNGGHTTEFEFIPGMIKGVVLVNITKYEPEHGEAIFNKTHRLHEDDLANESLEALNMMVRTIIQFA
ncbi:hypothetical protein ACMX2H_15990 [Arthrobacter sulfonylureivorans]|uniref:hypothetical protein n=1 Tax=Arthrobacter sulfonylureivorans TaxID=2486855 RepID=UPI0039E2F29D